MACARRLQIANPSPEEQKGTDTQGLHAKGSLEWEERLKRGKSEAVSKSATPLHLQAAPRDSGKDRESGSISAPVPP